MNSGSDGHDTSSYLSRYKILFSSWFYQPDALWMAYLSRIASYCSIVLKVTYAFLTRLHLYIGSSHYSSLNILLYVSFVFSRASLILSSIYFSAQLFFSSLMDPPSYEAETFFLVRVLKSITSSTSDFSSSML